MSQDIFLDVIIPFRYSSLRKDCINNLKLVLSEFSKQDVRFILVDSGSEKFASEIVNNICDKYNALYTHLKTQDEVFSIGKARDHGVAISTAKYILLQDIDLLPYQSFYIDIKKLIKDRFKTGADEVINIPCIYLSNAASREYSSIDSKFRKEYLLDCLRTGDDKIEFYGASSSVAIFDRYYYCTLGGHDPRFQGHGCEDFELFYRAYRNNTRFPEPASMYIDDGNWESRSYTGFRSWYRKYGDESALNGIFIAHIWHEREKSSDSYIKKSIANKNLLKECMVEFDTNNNCWLPPIPYSKNRTLFLGVEGSNFTESIREVIPSLGHVIYQCESFFKTEEFIADYISKNNIDQIFFHNPYANKERLNIYKYCRNHKIPYLIYERGALPGSVFFDSNGFNSDSASYHERNWNKELTNKEILSVSEFCENKIRGGTYLENQPQKMGGIYIKNKYRINGRKICFIPLQRPTDTVCKYFKGPLHDYTEFYAWVNSISRSLKDWVFMVKTHPLENRITYPFDNCQNVLNCDQENIDDLIDVADSIFLLNSGVGLLSILGFKNVVLVGDAFYHHKGLCNKAESPEEASKLISRDWKPDKAKVYKFLNYLINEFYSFGHFSTSTTIRNGAKLTITNKVKFKNIRILGQNIKKEFNSRKHPLFSAKSYLLGVKFSQIDIPRNPKKIAATQSFYTKLKIKKAIKSLIWKIIGPKNGVALISGVYRMLGTRKNSSKTI
ncbi:glycosyltransferase [Microbulbifer sp. TRSA002]|uniref:glycosyltransferase n=1 Tax=Microbulbifer sp. TRSA002 TaxID=3243382 RepID=UPI0040395761